MVEKATAQKCGGIVTKTYERIYKGHVVRVNVWGFATSMKGIIPWPDRMFYPKTTIACQGEVYDGE